MLAVALHGENVAPRFCSADEFVLAKLDGGRAYRICRLTVRDEAWSRRLERLSAAGVKVLLCGGFNRSLLPLAENLGIRVFSDLAGEAERLIAAFLRNELERYELLPYRRGHTGDGMARRGPGRAMNGGFDNEQKKRDRSMANYEGTGPLETGPRTGRGLGRRWAFGPGRKPTEESTGPGATAPQQESFRSGQVEALLTAELDRLKQAVSEYLRGDADELSEEVDGLKRLVSEYLRDDAEKLAAELDGLKQTLSECLRGDAETLTAKVDELKRLVSECLRGDAKDEE